MRVRVGHRIGRRSWISVGVPVRLLKPRTKTYRHKARADRKACRFVHLREKDVLLCEAEMRGGKFARALLVQQFADEAAESMRTYLAADRSKTEAWLGDIADELDV